MKKEFIPPHYSEKLLIRLIREEKTLSGLVDLCDLYRDLEAQKDIIITLKIKTEVMLQQKTIIYGGDILGNEKE